MKLLEEFGLGNHRGGHDGHITLFEHMSKERNSHRPLSARSLIASLLLRSQPPRMRAARLVQWCSLFGVADGTARVALSRMVDRGELRTVDGMYELAGRVGARRRTQDWSLAPAVETWDGHWRMAVVDDTTRRAADRSALRDAMRRLRYAEAREAVWTRPDNLPRASGPDDAWVVVDSQCQWWRSVPDGDAQPLAESLFGVKAWMTSARTATRKLAANERALGKGSERALADAFVAGAAALTVIRLDPLLPVELGEIARVGDELRTAYRRYEAAFTPAVRGWFRSH
jgi:phenylacetic acid degradation operon negative regulatory protein